MEQAVSIAVRRQDERVDIASRRAMEIIRESAGSEVAASVRLLADEVGASVDDLMERAIEIICDQEPEEVHGEWVQKLAADAVKWA
jgi:hypothetical protein